MVASISYIQLQRFQYVPIKFLRPCILPETVWRLDSPQMLHVVRHACQYLIPIYYIMLQQYPEWFKLEFTSCLIQDIHIISIKENT